MAHEKTDPVEGTEQESLLTKADLACMEVKGGTVKQIGTGFLRTAGCVLFFVVVLFVLLGAPALLGQCAAPTP